MAFIRTNIFLLLFLTGTFLGWSSDRVYGQLPLQIFETSDVRADSSYLIGRWVITESVAVTVDSELIPDTHWDYEAATGMWSFSPEYHDIYEKSRRLRITYRRLPLELRGIYLRNRPVIPDPTGETRPTGGISAIPDDPGDLSMQGSDLRESGSLSRGIVVGTNQDLALESGLQFELTGNLTEDVSITASLTDRSIPIQPDGTTQNIREFDRVYIRLDAPRTSVEMGDVDARFTAGTFARLNRRLQGAAGTTSGDWGAFKGALSVVRGTFNTKNFTGRDGVQGPYRLTNREGEEFVIILAGTEKVYFNGRLLTRGEENDYIIDYGLGEIYFTNNMLVKDESRFFVEYEYVDQDFNRTLAAAEAGESWFDERLSIGVSVIRQADGDELLSQQVLSESDISVLSGVGDDLGSAVVSGARLPSEDDNRPRYSRVDTTLNGVRYEIFRHLPGDPQARFVVSFSRVEEGEGSYRRISGTVNGILYEWVGPGMGNYEPFRELPAPQLHQMASLRTSARLSEHIRVFGDLTASSFDRNRFSTMDDDDNNDLAYKAGLEIDKLETGVGALSVQAYRRSIGEHFRVFERINEVEFDRKWNILRSGEEEETIDQLDLGLNITPQTVLTAEAGTIERPGFRGIRQGSTIRMQEEHLLDLDYFQEWIRSTDERLDQKGNWFRNRGRATRTMGVFAPYIWYEQEYRAQRSVVTDSLTPNSLAFFEMAPGIRYESGNWEIDLSILYRKEERVLNNRLRDESFANEQRVSIGFRPSSYISTRNSVTLRNKTFTEPFISNGASNRRGVLLNSVTKYRTPDDLIDGQVQYEVTTRSQALLQEAYIEVGPELGQFIWQDTNGDGVQQLDEFFPELSPNEGTFIVQFLPSDELFPSIDLRTRLINEITPFARMDVSEGEGWKEILRAVNIRSRFDISENSTTEDLSDIYLLRLNTFRNDSTTVQGRLYWEQELDLLDGMDRAEFRVGISETQSLNQRSTESVRNSTQQSYLEAGWRFTGRVRGTLNAGNTQERTVSDRIVNRNYDIRSGTVRPGVEWLVNRNWQTNAEISYTRKEDTLPVEPTRVDLFKFIQSNRFFLRSGVQFNSRLELRSTRVEGTSSALGFFELTEGTGEGTNLVWSLNAQYRISELVRLTFSYDGRTVRERENIHAIKMVVSAVF